MRLVDLFSGIGGFSLAASWVWGDELEIVAFCECDPFCQKVLHKHWPNVEIVGDVRDVKKANVDDTEGGRCGFRETSDIGQNTGDVNPFSLSDSFQPIDLLTGGFPCQPFSCAGKRKGKEDDRFLWPEMLRVIKEFKPRWIVAENVAGIESIFQYDSFSELEGKEYQTKEEATDDFRGILEREGTNMLWVVLEDLAKIGYDVQPVIIPACAVNAPHRRDRVWIVGRLMENANISRNAQSGLFKSDLPSKSGENVADTGSQERDRLSGIRREEMAEIRNTGKAEPNPLSFHDDRSGHGAGEVCRERGKEAELSGSEDATHGFSTGLEVKQCQPGNDGAEQPTIERDGDERRRGKLESRFCGMDDGTTKELDLDQWRDGEWPGVPRVAKGVPDRVNRLKALGNSIVWPVAAQIMRAIKEVDEHKEAEMDYVSYSSPEAAALKRASLDLTRALSAMRKTGIR